MLETLSQMKKGSAASIDNLIHIKGGAASNIWTNLIEMKCMGWAGSGQVARVAKAFEGGGWGK